MSSLISANDLHKVFEKLDTKGDGLISIDQLRWLLERIGYPTSLEELLPLVGTSETLDCIDFFLFYDIAVKQSCNNNGGRRSHEDDLAEAFKVFDLNGDGFISCEELEKVLLRFGLWNEGGEFEQDGKIMIGRFDTNSDGLLDFEEFRCMMMVSS